MRTCRIKYSVLGLLVYYLQCSFAWSCASDFEDVASKTVTADLVFEGRPLNKGPLKGANHGYYYYNFRIVSLIKGNFSNIYLSSLQHLPQQTTSPTIPARKSYGFHLSEDSRSHENTWSHNRVRNDNNHRYTLSHPSQDTYTKRRRNPRLEYSQVRLYRPQRRSVRSVKAPVKKPKGKFRRRVVAVKQFGATEDVSDCVASQSMNRHKTYLVFLRLPRRSSPSPSKATTRRQTTIHHLQHKAYSAKRSRESRSFSNNARQRHRRSLRHNRNINNNRKTNLKRETNNKTRKKSKKRVPKRTIYSISSMPVLSTGSAKAVARHHSCLNCKQKARVMSISPPKKVVIGRDANVTCRLSGLPRPEVYWLKNGLVLTEDHISIRNRRVNISRVDSTLMFDGSTENDTGLYQCFGVNVVGESQLVRTSVSIVSKHRKPFSERCANQHYCFNHGECFKLIDRESFFCQCKDDFVGDRCQEKNTNHHVFLMGRRKRRRRSSLSHPTHLHSPHHHLNR